MYSLYGVWEYFNCQDLFYDKNKKVLNRNRDLVVK